MKMIVTGGAGFIGSNFVRMALKEGHQVVVLDLLTYAGHESTLREVKDLPSFSFIKGDVADRALVRQLIGQHLPDAIVHLAAETHVDRSIDDPSGFLKTNIMGTFEMMEACRHQASLPPGFRFLLVSTDEVYGALGQTGFFSETSPYAPNSPYAASKASADLLARSFHETFRFPVIITNCSNNYGPRQFPEKLIPLMILNALEGKELPVYGDGMQVRDWIHVDDHCAGILSALKSGKPGSHYLFGSRSERANLQVLETILRAIEEFRPASKNPALKAKGLSDYNSLRKFVKDRPGHDRRYAIDPSLAEKELDWKITKSFEVAIRDTTQWYLDNLEWCRLVQKDRYGRERLGLSLNPVEGEKK
jgi:dTDP-glucose 4,6-dehydratase